MSTDRKLGLLPEYDSREVQLAVLLENLESFMIRETSNRVLRDITLIKAEKVNRKPVRALETPAPNPPPPHPTCDHLTPNQPRLTPT